MIRGLFLLLLEIAAVGFICQHRVDATPRGREQAAGEVAYATKSAARGMIFIDRIAPTAKDAARVLLPGEAIEAIDAVCDIRDQSPVTATWESEPDFVTPGAHSGVIRLQDRYRNVTVMGVSYTVLMLPDQVVCPIGGERPEAKLFFGEWDGEAEFVTDLDSIDWNRPGPVEVELTAKGLSFRSTLLLVDETAPILEVHPLCIKTGTPVTAEDFVTSCEDMSPVSFRLELDPDVSFARQTTITVVAEDEGGNLAFAETTLYVCDELIQLEAGAPALSETLLRAKLPAGYASFYKADIPEFNPDKPGITVFHVANYANDRRTIGIVVRDTTPPKATLAPISCYLGYPRQPEDFLQEIRDASAVTVRFSQEPDWNTQGSQTVSLVLSDAYGNSSEMSFQTDIRRDETPPTIYAALDRTCYVGEAVAYFKEVFAVDDADPDCVLTVDKSAVNSRKEGTYPVTYTATDRDGNSTSVTVQYTFIKARVSEEEIDALVDDLLGRILTDDMSVAEQIKAIYSYIYYHIHYVGSSDKSDWKAEAYHGLTTFKGDCFTYYAASYLLLSRIDCQVLSVERQGGLTHHYWCLVNVGTGWYHFDACNAGPEELFAFMMTDAQLEYYGNDYYWHYDKSLYPPVETERFQMF